MRSTTAARAARVSPMEIVTRVAELKRSLDESRSKLKQKRDDFLSLQEELALLKERGRELERRTQERLLQACQVESRLSREKIATQLIRDEWRRSKSRLLHFKSEQREKRKEVFVDLPHNFAERCKRFQEARAQEEYDSMRRMAESEAIAMECEVKRISEQIESRRNMIVKTEQEMCSLESDICMLAAGNESHRTKVSLLISERQKMKDALQRISEEGRVFDFQEKEVAIQQLGKELVWSKNRLEHLRRQVQACQENKKRLETMLAGLNQKPNGGSKENARSQGPPIVEKEASILGGRNMEHTPAARPIPSLQAFNVRHKARQKQKGRESCGKKSTASQKDPLVLVAAAQDPFGGCRH